jgi:hypothetical protein
MSQATAQQQLGGRKCGVRVKQPLGHQLVPSDRAAALPPFPDIPQAEPVGGGSDTQRGEPDRGVARPDEAALQRRVVPGTRREDHELGRHLDFVERQVALVQRAQPHLGDRPALADPRPVRRDQEHPGAVCTQSP